MKLNFTFDGVILNLRGYQFDIHNDFFLKNFNVYSSTSYTLGEGMFLNTSDDLPCVDFFFEKDSLEISRAEHSHISRLRLSFINAYYFDIPDVLLQSLFKVQVDDLGFKSVDDFDHSWLLLLKDIKKVDQYHCVILFGENAVRIACDEIRLTPF